MNTATTIRPELLFAPHPNLGGETARPSLSTRLRMRFARFADYFQSYDDYYAEMERSLPMPERERREARRQADRLFQIAMLRG